MSTTSWILLLVIVAMLSHWLGRMEKSQKDENKDD